MVSWYISYRSSFPDPTETESLSNILKLIKDTKNGNASWDICVLPTKDGKVAAAFSGQALDVKLKDGSMIGEGWGEHIFVAPEFRKKGYGRSILHGFADKLSKQFGPRDMIVIEVDNAFGILNSEDPKNAVYFDHRNPAERQAAWTDPKGENMAMDPFRRMKVWDRMGFMLMAVSRKDVSGLIAAPYTQIPLDKGGEPCETIILAVRPSPEMKAKFESGEIGALEMNRVYRAMMKTVSGTYNQDASYKAVQAELRLLRSPKIQLIRFYGDDGELNPQAIEILKTTAQRKLRS
jgi:GNAT superfamily N-acetyltransferase